VGAVGIALRAEVLGVLAYVARHRPGGLVTKDKLSEYVWGVADFGDTQPRMTVPPLCPP
jgi:DNA-binding winged helix-turn-helix (wHTH) protein